jgi:hypothetical protein
LPAPVSSVGASIVTGDVVAALVVVVGVVVVVAEVAMIASVDGADGLDAFPSRSEIV